MATQSPPPAKIYTDILSEFSQGMNSGVLPQLLPRSQCAFAINTTFRGAFATHRPPYARITLAFPSDAIKTSVEKGFYQGGGWYRPDTGPLQIVSQISGRLFTFTKTSPGNYVVAEISIPGDLNNPSVSQVWMWQSEKWLIVTDGSLKFPIFYDGSTSRRSFGPSRLLATGIAFNPASPPPTGETVVVKLAAPYVGPVNVPVLFNQEHYQIVSFVTIPATDPPPVPGPVAEYKATLVQTNGSSWSGVIGDNIVIKPTEKGVVTSTGTLGTFGCKKDWDIRVHLSTPYIGSIGDIQTIPVVSSVGSCPPAPPFTRNFTVTNIGSGYVDVHYSEPVDVILVIQNGVILSGQGVNDPDVLVAKLAANYPSNPAAATQVFIDRPYTGPANQVVWIGTFRFTMTLVPPDPPDPPIPGTPEAYYMTLLNLSDTSGANYVNPEPILSIAELPSGRMGAYGMGQTWLSLPDGMSFIASDPVGFSSGLPIFNYRDAVLRTLGADSFLAASGGSFRIPTSGQRINSMTFTANLDTSLGQGNLQVGTDSNIFSCLAPFDYTATTLPPVILTESLIGFGPLAQNSTIIANSDLLFRSFIGLGSLVLARRQFEQELTWGNTPISREMTRVFTRDDEALLPFGSAVVFDNRLLDTCSPNISVKGTFHLGLVALNFDLVSSLRGKAPPVYDGMWTGLNALQVINIQSGSEARAFIFSVNIPESKIELYELLKSEDRVYFDNGVSPIRWIIETPVMFNQDVKPLPELVRITNGEIWVQDIVGTVNVVVQYRPDFYSGSEQPGCWETWTEFEICATAVGENVRPSYRTRIGLGEPSGARCQDGNNRPFRVGHFFQFRLEFIGSAKFMALRVEAVVQPQADFAPPDCDAACLPAPTLPELVIP